MKDLIEERNRRERMQKSIIKWWNVNWVPVQDEKDEFAKLSEKEKKAAQEIISRLDAEAAADEAIKAKEVEEALRQQEKDANYNAATGSYSGTYGQQEVEDEEAKSRIENILKEKENSFMQSMEEMKNQIQ